METRLEPLDEPSGHHLTTIRGDTMFHSELELRVRYEELRRRADRQRLEREATEARRAGRRGAARSGADEPEGWVSTWGRRARIRRATA
ncbi:hypothetical protein [Streptomyces lydicamycinicus]|nr:hypothetical protein [Streptomyces lydicamycinicus]